MCYAKFVSIPFGKNTRLRDFVDYRPRRTQSRYRMFAASPTVFETSVYTCTLCNGKSQFFPLGYDVIFEANRPIWTIVLFRRIRGNPRRNPKISILRNKHRRCPWRPILFLDVSVRGFSTFSLQKGASTCGSLCENCYDIDQVRHAKIPKQTHKNFPRKVIF